MPRTPDQWRRWTRQLSQPGKEPTVNIQEALARADDVSWNGEPATETGNEDWDLDIEALVVLANEVRRTTP